MVITPKTQNVQLLISNSIGLKNALVLFFQNPGFIYIYLVNGMCGFVTRESECFLLSVKEYFFIHSYTVYRPNNDKVTFTKF